MNLYENTPIMIRALKKHVQASTYATIKLEHIPILISIPVTVSLVREELVEELTRAYPGREMIRICIGLEHEALFAKSKPYFHHLKNATADILSPLTQFLELILNSGTEIDLETPFHIFLMVTFK